MNAFRYYLALIYCVMIPPAILLWLVIHPFVAFWRRLGLFRTYVVLLAAEIVGTVGLFVIRKPLLSVEFGGSWPLLVLGLAGVVTAVRLRVRLHRQFSNRQMLGLPELAPDRFPQKLVTEGLHGQVRHPRYLQFFLVAASFALMANYLILYVMLAILIPVIWLVVVFEEKELRDRFGPAYEEYSRRVPRFIPRRGSKS